MIQSDSQQFIKYFFKPILKSQPLLIQPIKTIIFIVIHLHNTCVETFFSQKIYIITGKRKVCYNAFLPQN